MKTITIEVPDDTTLPFTGSDEQFASELRLAAAIFWYDRGLISQGKGAEIAGLTRADFTEALGRANIHVLQTTTQALKGETTHPENARSGSCETIPSNEELPRIYIRSPRLAEPERAADFIMEVAEESRDAGLR